MRFQPTVPMRGRSGDVELTLRHLRLGAKREVVFESRSTAPHTIRGGWVTVATRDPCSGGAEIAEVIVDRARPDGLARPGSCPRDSTSSA